MIIKKCPFCGGDAVIKTFKKGEVVAKFWDQCSDDGRKALTNLPDKWSMIGCNDPECILYYDTRHHAASLFFRSSGKKDIIKKWNRRVNNDSD